MKLHYVLFIPVILIVQACGGGSSDVNETLTIVGRGGPSQPIGQSGVDFREFRLGAGVVQMRPIADRPLRNGTDENPISSVVDDVDFIKIVADYIGIPYEEFSKNAEIPANNPWAVVARRLASEALATERPLLLQLGFVRGSMVGRAVDDDGELLVDLTWAPSCLDLSLTENSEIGDAYINYAMWMVREFKPAYVVSFAEANIFFTECGGASPAWDAIVDIQQRAYDAIKMFDPTIVVFASFNLEALYGETLDGWDEEQYQALSKMEYDSFAMASYPFGVRLDDGSFVTPYDLPSDYLSRVLTLHPDEKRLSIVETGWNNESIAAGDENICFENFPYSDHTFVRDFLEFTLNSAISNQMLLLTWFSSIDVLPPNVISTCYVHTDSTDPDNDACNNDFWCQAVNQAKNTVAIPGAQALFSEVVLKAFGTMGLREYDGASRNLLLDRWREVLALPLQDVTIADQGG
jgi:hypothetical protein